MNNIMPAWLSHTTDVHIPGTKCMSWQARLNNKRPINYASTVYYLVQYKLVRTLSACYQTNNWNVNSMLVWTSSSVRESGWARQRGLSPKTTRFGGDCNFRPESVLWLSKSRNTYVSYTPGRDTYIPVLRINLVAINRNECWPRLDFTIWKSTTLNSTSTTVLLYIRI